MAAKCSAIERIRFILLRATSILCLVGFGLGLGSVLIYRFCARFFSPAIGATCRRKRALSPSTSDRNHATKQSRSDRADMPPEAFDDHSVPNTRRRMGNNSSSRTHATRSASVASLSAAYTPHEGVSFRGIRRKYSCDTPSSDSNAKQARLHQSPVAALARRSVDSDCGFVSGSLSDWPTSGFEADLDGMSAGGYSLLPNFSPSSLDERSRDAMRAMAAGCSGADSGDRSYYPGFAHSTPDTMVAPTPRKRTQSMACSDEEDFLDSNLSLRRQPFSVPADLNASVQSEEALRDCLGPDENTPDFLRPRGIGIGGRTVSEMELIQSELNQLQRDISSMNDEVRQLNSDDKPTISLPPPISPPPMSPTPVVVPLRAVKRQRHQSQSSTCSLADEHEMAPPTNRWSYHHGNEYMWDYQSDLLDGASKGVDFVASRPVVGNFFIGSPDSRPESPSYDDVRCYFERHNSLTNSLTDTRNAAATLSDLYIDDDIDHILNDCGSGVVMDNFDNVTNKNFHNNNVNDYSHWSSSSSSPLHAVSPICRKTAVISPATRMCQNEPTTGGATSGKQMNHVVVEDWHVDNLMPKWNVYEYAEREWRGNGQKAQTIKRGYHRIPDLFGLSNLRRVRADNYCAVRAVLYQLLVNNLAAQNKNLASRQQVLQRLHMFEERQYGYLQSWHFANRLPYSRDRVVERVSECVSNFYAQVEKLSQMGSYGSRERHLQQLLNGQPEMDVQLLETVKLLMQLSAISLHEDAACGNTVPVFAWLLFARETSTSPEMLFRNHINHIGDTTTLQQVEMYLLGYTLGVKIEVARPMQLGKEEFISHYPDDGADSFPKVYLVADDERHYNVVVP